MANFTAADVKKLREQTGCGMMDCKKALTESDGDFEKAVEFLREKGLAAAEKKASRIAAEGLVVSVVEGNVGVVLEVNAETDFVAKNETFVEFVNNVAKTIIKNNPADVEELGAMHCENTDMTVTEALNDRILVIGENMKIRRFVRMEGNLVPYVHGGGKIGVLVNFDTDCADKEEFQSVGKDIAMQIAFSNPSYLCESEVPADVVAKEKEIIKAQMDNDPKMAQKPDKVKDGIVNGRIGKFYQEVCLLDQPFVKEEKVSVKQHVAEAAKAMGGKMEIIAYVRLEKGEGLEKREDNFADEVASMVK
ncbi:MAG TPA: elongation factor Ts [Candidatus Merdivicinus intestinavium]|nr:elongation factor Ts [Candidatus Merdivicinus intestinavium]